MLIHRTRLMVLETLGPVPCMEILYAHHFLHYLWSQNIIHMSKLLSQSLHCPTRFPLTWNCFSKPVFPLKCLSTFFSLSRARRRSEDGIWVSPQISVSSTASWMNAYWSCTNHCQSNYTGEYKEWSTYNCLDHLHSLFPHVNNDLWYVHLSLFGGLGPELCQWQSVSLFYPLQHWKLHTQVRNGFKKLSGSCMYV